MKKKSEIWADRKAALRAAFGDDRNPYLYAYSPGDTRGTRYVFTDTTVIGVSNAIIHADELLLNKEA